MKRICTMLAAAMAATAPMAAENSLSSPLTVPYNESFSGCEYQSEP